MTFDMAADEDLEQYDDIDQFDDPRHNDPGFDLRGGGTDLFRAVLVLLIAAAVGALILTRGFGDSSASDDQDAAAETVEADDATDAGAATDDPASPATDGTTGDATTADDAMDDGTATTTAADGAATTATDATAADGTTAESTTSTLAMSDGSVARDPQEVEVLVLNATETKGIAAQASELLQISKYNTAPAGNATISGIGSVIYYMEGYRADAIAVAQVFTDGLDGLVAAYDPAKPPSDEIGTANVIVILGVDEAIPIG